MKEVTIVWIEKTRARIITCNSFDIVETHHILSSEPELPPSGTTPEYKVSIRTIRDEFYDNIICKIENAREIVLFGSDNRKEKFLEYLDDRVKPVFAKVIGVESALDLQEEKIIARGRKYL